MDKARDLNAKQNKSEKKKYHRFHSSVGFKNKTNEQRGKERKTKKQTLNSREQTDGYQREGGCKDGSNR